MSTEPKYAFTITGPSASFGTWQEDADVTDAYWGDEVPEPLTLEEITGLVECFPENGPVTWHLADGFGTFTTLADYIDTGVRKMPCSISLVAVTDEVVP